MRKIFLSLLKKYTKTEKDRLIVFKTLHKSVSEDYTEQTPFGNVYNATIEFIISSDFINGLKTDKTSLCMIKSNIVNSIPDAFKIIENE